MDAPRGILVESLPLGLEDLARVPATADALVDLLLSATTTIAVTAMYSSLRPVPAPPDTDAWTSLELQELFGAAEGGRVYDALDAAAARGVQLRILQSPGFAPDDEPMESELLAAAHPGLVEIREVDLDAWFGQGILHQKIVVVDGRAAYVGSANMDWRSLTQVKELGLVLIGEVEVVADLLSYFDDWWEFAGSRAPATPVDANAEGTARSGSRPASSWAEPRRTTLDGVEGEAVVSGSPRRLCAPPRTEDAELLAATIRDAAVSVDVNVMDFAPISISPAASPGSTRTPRGGRCSSTRFSTPCSRGASVRGYWSASGSTPRPTSRPSCACCRSCIAQPASAPACRLARSRSAASSFLAGTRRPRTRRPEAPTRTTRG